MFSAILMVAMTTGVQAPEFFFKNKAESCGTPVVVSSCSGCCGGREGVMARLHDKADKKGCCGGEVVSHGCCGGREPDTGQACNSSGVARSGRYARAQGGAR